MKKGVVSGFIFCMLIMSSFVVYAEEPSNEIIVKYSEGMIGNGNEVTDEKNQQVTVYEYVPEPDSITKLSKEEEIYALRFTDENMQEVVNYYNEMEEVVYAEENSKLYFFKTPDDTSYPQRF